MLITDGAIFSEEKMSLLYEFFGYLFAAHISELTVSVRPHIPFWTSLLSLCNKIVTILPQIMVTHCAVGALRALVADWTEHVGWICQK